MKIVEVEKKELGVNGEPVNKCLPYIKNIEQKQNVTVNHLEFDALGRNQS